MIDCSFLTLASNGQNFSSYSSVKPCLKEEDGICFTYVLCQKRFLMQTELLMKKTCFPKFLEVFLLPEKRMYSNRNFLIRCIAVESIKVGQ